MGKKVLRLTEFDLHRIVKESVDRIMKEYTRDFGYTDDNAPSNRPTIGTPEYYRRNDRMQVGQEPIYSNARNWDDPNYNRKQSIGDSKPFAKGMEESCNEESFKNNQNYTHFAVSKRSGKILNGWDYSEYDPSELRQFKKDYFDIDMQDYGFDPKSYKIVTGKYLLRQGVDPDDNSNWANNDEANADWIG